MIQDTSQSSFGLTPSVAAGLASFFGLIGGIVILAGRPPQQWVRFVAVQAIVLFAAYFVFEIAYSIVLGITSALPGVRIVLVPLLLILQLVVCFGVFVAWLIATVKAFSGSALRLPFIAQIADRYASLPSLG